MFIARAVERLVHEPACIVVHWVVYDRVYARCINQSINESLEGKRQNKRIGLFAWRLSRGLILKTRSLLAALSGVCSLDSRA